MSQFPAGLDSDTDLPRVDNNLTEIAALAINALRDAMFAVEANIGVNAQGATGSIAQRLNTSLDPLGRILPSALAGIGLVYLPITDAEISPVAGIQESKLNLTYTTNTLYNLYQNLKNAIDVLNGFLSLTGIKVEPHIDGLAYNHDLSAILVDNTLLMLKTLPGANVQLPGTSVQNRNTTNADTLIKDLSDDLLIHEKSNGSVGIEAETGGTVPPIGFAHVATGLYIDTSPFSVIPQTSNTLQLFAEFVDSSSLLLIGSRTQNLFSNGVSRAARSFSLTADGYGSSIVPPTPIVAYLLGVPPGPIATSPVDDINHGDDVILFQPTAAQLSSFNFDAQFSQVAPGDLITVNYGNGITAQFAVNSVKAIVSGTTRVYAVRINAKNLYSTSNGTAQIDKPFFNTNKYGVLSVSRCPNQMGVLESLITAQPRGAIVLGNGFNPSLFDNSHFNLYLTMYQGGNPTNPLMLPPIDVTGNQGATPGQYTLDSIVNSANQAFRAAGFNYRFTAFEYQGEFGIMLADDYNNTSFSVISGVVNNSGSYTATSLSSYPNNAVDNYGSGINSIDPLGFGLSGANVASPPSTLYTSVAAAQFAPTLIFYPLTRNYYYVNGVERDTLRSDPGIINQILDGYGDGYWPGTILPAPATLIFANRVQVAYQINLDLSTSGIEIGKSIVVQPAFPTSDARYNFRDYGRFIIQNISFSGCDTSNPITIITVYDGVHGAGVSPAITSTSIPVNIYFSDDSVGFNIENVADQSSAGYPYKRFFEIYVDQSGHTFTHERARYSITSAQISSIGLYSVSPKLLGYVTAVNSSEYLNTIQLSIINYNSTTGIYTGQLVNPNAPLVNFGPVTTGKKGQPVRFYDETNIDYIDFIFDESSIVSSFASQNININLFNSLELNQQNFLLSTCQVNDSTGQVSYLNDKRQFGNTSEDNFTTSAQDYIAAPTRLLNSNGIIRGFDILTISGNKVNFDGGEAVVNGKIVQLNAQVIEIPAVLEAVGGSVSTTVNVITWFICVNSSGELILIASTDYDQNGSFASIYQGLSLDNTRLFYAMNPNISAPTAYQVRGTYFGDLILNQTDITPIAVATGTTTLSSTTYIVSILTCNDARRYVYGDYGGMADPFVLSNNGSFRTLASAITWLTQLSNFISSNSENNTFNPVGNTIIVKGDIIISSPTTLNFLNTVTFKGDGGVFIITSATGFIVTNGVSFDGVRFDYTHNPASAPDPGYSSSNLVNSFNAAIYSAISTTNKNIVVKNCFFNSFTSDHYPFISFEFTGNQAVLQNVIIRNNNIINNAGVQDLRASIVFNSISENPASSFPFVPKMVGVFIEDNICDNNQMIIITAPRSGVAVAAPFVACTHVKITGNICGVIGFMTSYDIPSTNDNSFYDGIIRDKSDNLFISGNTCKFIANIDATGQYVSFATIASYGPGLPGPINTLLAWEPATFIITNVTATSPVNVTVTTSNPNIFITGLQVTVKGITGVTGANVYGVPITFVSSTLNSVTFSLNGTVGGGSYTGGGFVYTIFNTVNNGTGPFLISENICNWIQVGTYSDTNGGGNGIIINNKLHPYNPVFLRNYTDTICSVAPINAAIVLNQDTGQSTTNCIISHNVISQKLNFNGTLVNYTYDQGILSFNNAIIENNFINSCVTSSLNNTYMILGNNGNLITHNMLTRGTASILTYVGVAESVYNNPILFIFNPKIVVTGNVFDSIFTDASNSFYNDINTGFGNAASYNNNTNQVSYAAVPLYNYGVGTNTATAGTLIQMGTLTAHDTGTFIQFSESSPPGFSIPFNFRLSDVLPTGVKLLYATVGINNPLIVGGTTVDVGSGSSNIFMGIYSNITNSISTPVSPTAPTVGPPLATSIADVASVTIENHSYTPNSAFLDLTVIGNVNNLTANTVFLNMDMNSTTEVPTFTCYTGVENEYVLILDFFQVLTVAPSTACEIDISPIILRYAWT